MLELRSARVLGAIGAVLYALGYLPFDYGGFVLTMGFMLQIIAVHKISRAVNDKAIFKNYLVSAILLAVRTILGIITLLAFNVALDIVLAKLFIMLILTFASAVFLARSFKSIARKLNVPLFSTAALIYLLGAATVIIGVGSLIILAASLITIVAFLEMPEVFPPPPLPSQPPLFPPPPPPAPSGGLEKTGMQSTGEETLDSEIMLTVDELIRIAENWVNLLRKTKDGERLFIAATLGFAVWLVTLISAVIMVPVGIGEPTRSTVVTTIPLALSIAVGVSVFLILRRRKHPFSDLVELLNKVKLEAGRQKILDAQDLIDRLTMVTPRIKQYKRHDAPVYAFLTAIATLIILSAVTGGAGGAFNTGIALLTGSLVFLYFTRKLGEYDREVARFEELKRRLTQERSNLKSL